MAFVNIAPEAITRLQGGKYWVPTTITDLGDVLKLRFGFNRELLNEIKSMAGARWNPDGKYWTVTNSERNWFQLAFLAGERPYDWYDRTLVELDFERPLYSHQKCATSHGLTYHYGIWAMEMGTGKSLSGIEVMERSGNDDWLYVGPKSAIASFQLELLEWKSKIIPKIVTYEGLKKLVENWPKGKKAPFGVLFDESSRVKNPTSQRSQAAYHLAQSIRRDWGREGYVILMSGSPAPKSPADWWWQCEIACPGFIREGTIEKFKARLGLIVQKESLTGGVYPHLITWKDDEMKCAKCGQFESHVDHTPPDAFAATLGQSVYYHPFEKSVNEISYLYERMKGLVLVKFKKDCLKELPEKRYRIIECKPRPETLNAAKIIAASATTTISGLTLLRELSDGFQYVSTEVGSETCPTCKGSCLTEQPVPIVDQEELDEAMAELAAQAEQEGWPTDEFGMPVPEHLLLADKYEMQMLPCYRCGGVGTVLQYTREAVQVPCPKEDAFKDILDSHEEDGRLVAYGGFTGSVDRIVQTCEKMTWEWIRVDGRGWSCSPRLGKLGSVQMLQLFQKQQAQHPRVCFVGQPSSSGMGLTLTSSCEIVYYSNDFNAESRIQSEDRIHRPGMDVNKGALITDLIHLPTDLMVRDNLQKKRKLQDMSLGSFHDALKSMSAATERRI